MDRLKILLEMNEEWLKENVLELVQTYGGRSSDLEHHWSELFGKLIKDAPSTSRLDVEVRDKECKEEILSLFQSLDTPAILLHEDLTVDSLNPAARAALDLKDEDEAANLSGPLISIAPWLAGVVQGLLSEDRLTRNVHQDVSVPASYGEKHFSVSVSRLSGMLSAFSGYIVTLDDISFRVEAEKSLREERSMVARYLDMVGSIIVVQDVSGSVTMINRVGCQILGYEEQQILGHNWVDRVVPEEQKDELLDYFSLILSGQGDVDEEHANYVVTRDGAHRLINWKNKLLTNAGGIPVGILSSGMDVTEQRAMEETLFEKELWLRNTFVALGEAVLILTPDRKILDANPAAESMFGMTNEELEGLPLQELHVDRRHYEGFLIRSKAAFDKGEKALFELALKRSDGTVFPADHSVSLIIGDDGQPLGIVNTIRDISDRKKAEKVLQKSEEKFRRIFESIEEGYIVTDLDGTVQMVNPATCRMFGFSESELVGRNVDHLYALKRDRSNLRKLLAKNQRVRGFQVQGQRKDGSSFVLEANACLLRNEDGDSVAMEGTFRDISHRIAAEKILLERERQYRAFFENNHAIMLLVDPKTELIIDANPAASEFYGYSVDEMREMKISQINALTQDEIFREMQLSREEGRSSFIMKHILVNGDVRDVEVYSGPIMVNGKQRLYSVIHDVTRRIRLEKKMKRLATIDGLTGVNNRHNFFVLGSRELVRTKRYEIPLTVLMLDIDYFKSINDTHGHQAGDLVLRMLAAASIATLRETDVFGRIGGEEFAVILPETGLKAGLEVAERLREVYAGLEARVGDAIITFTVSIGVTLVRPHDNSIEEIVNRADEALYKAKRMGRNRVERA